MVDHSDGDGVSYEKGVDLEAQEPRGRDGDGRYLRADDSLLEVRSVTAVHVLSDGQRVIEVESVEALFTLTPTRNDDTTADAGDLDSFIKWKDGR